MTVQYAWATVAVIAYLLLCWTCLAKRQQAHAYRQSDSAKDEDNQVLVAYASQGGQAKELAKQYADSLQSHIGVVLVTLNQVNDSLLKQSTTALFIVSTYGEGEPPDNALYFHRQWLRNTNTGASSTPLQLSHLSHLQFGVLALGDSQYHHFCQFGISLTQGLIENGAEPLFDTVKVDCLNNEHLSQWQKNLSNLGLVESSTAEQPSNKPDFRTGKILEQQFLNPNSPGDPVFHVRITPPTECHWKAGDILHVHPNNNPSISAREYSIASTPKDGSIDLLVRQQIHDDGSLGLGSGWLTHHAPHDSDILMHVRENPSFHLPDKNTPLILIGNGTGIAGLKALLKGRENTGSSAKNALFFGERTRAHDFFFQTDIEGWQKDGLLDSVHLAFSRDQPEKYYVQDLIREQQTLINSWVAEGASLFVCGSLQGMASSVDTVLKDILGGTQLEKLKIAGRYKRDVY